MRLSWILVFAPLSLAACGGQPDVVVAAPPQAASAPPTIVVPAQPPERPIIVQPR